MALNAHDYDASDQHRSYREGRAMPVGMMARWMDVFGEIWGPKRPLSLIDLGSGTGRLTPGLAEEFDGPVFGVEPSANMRAEAETGSAHAAVAYLAGEAAAIPMPDASADGVLMFLSFHHVKDRPAAAREIRRVLNPGGRLILRSNFRERMPDIWWRHYFPRSLEIEQQMFPTVADVEAVFGAAGFKRHGLVEVPEVFHETAEDAVARLKLRAITTFEYMTEAEIQEGFARLETHVAAGTFRLPPPQRSDILVLG